STLKSTGEQKRIEIMPEAENKEEINTPGLESTNQVEKGSEFITEKSSTTISNPTTTITNPTIITTTTTTTSFPPTTTTLLPTTTTRITSSREIICSYNAYNCSDFKTQAEAQAVFEYCGGVNNDVHQLDKNHDGVACESLQ
ncbi:MAG: excalibur calcium-binding domain-containing protein, partial [Candidatus Paceibacterota bacterium]